MVCSAQRSERNGASDTTPCGVVGKLCGRPHPWLIAPLVIAAVLRMVRACAGNAWTRALTNAGCGNIGRRINHAPRRTRLPMRPDDPAMLGITLTNSDLDTTDDESEDDGAWLELDDAIDRSGRTHSLSPAGIDWLADLVAFEEAQQAMAARVGVKTDDKPADLDDGRLPLAGSREAVEAEDDAAAAANNNNNNNNNNRRNRRNGNNGNDNGRGGEMLGHADRVCS